MGTARAVIARLGRGQSTSLHSVRYRPEKSSIRPDRSSNIGGQSSVAVERTADRPDKWPNRRGTMREKSRMVTVHDQTTRRARMDGCDAPF